MSNIPAASLKAIRERSQDKCERCGTAVVGDVNRSTHHRRHLGMGGSKRASSATPCNLIRLCGDGTTGCHGWIEHHDKLARQQGLVVGQNDNPAFVPVKLMDPVSLQLHWVLLLAVGGVQVVASHEVIEAARKTLLEGHHGHQPDECACVLQVAAQVDSLAMQRLLAQELAA